VEFATVALKPCRECQKEISTDAKACPNCGKRSPHRKNVSCLGVFLALLVTCPLLAFIFASTSNVEQNHSKKPEFGFIDKNGALTLCENQLTQMAKYPSSVEFPFGENRVYQEKKGDVIVLENFTALNGFGARLPHQGICRLRKNGTVKINISNR